jgi:Ala-tRNA(Pro) deacylase
LTAVTQRVVDYLAAENVEFRVIEHNPAGSAEEYHEVLGTRYEQQAKAIFLRFKRPGEKGFAILAIQAQKRADLEKVRRLLDAREARLGTVEQLREATGCEFGELPPSGKIFDLQLLFDTDLLTEDEIYFNAGDLGVSIALDPKELERIEEPIRY